MPLWILAPWWPEKAPGGGFYLWPDVGGDDTAFVRALYEQQNITILPGSFMSRDTSGAPGSGIAGSGIAGGGNPGRGRVRISLVPTIAECVDAAQRIAAFLARR